MSVYGTIKSDATGLGDPKSLSASFTCRGTRGPKLKETSDLRPPEIAEPQATSNKLDKLQAIGYYEVRKAGHMTDKKTMTISDAVERMITAVNIVTGDDGSRAKRAVVTFIELLKMNKKDYAKQQKFYG